MLRGLGLIVKGLDDELAEAIYTASLVGDEQALSAALEKMPESAADEGWHIIDRYGCEPLGQACAHGHLAAVNLLLEKGADVNAMADTCGRTALHRAASGGHTECVARLIEEMVSPRQVRTDASAGARGAGVRPTPAAPPLLTVRARLPFSRGRWTATRRRATAATRYSWRRRGVTRRRCWRCWRRGRTSTTPIASA